MGRQGGTSVSWPAMSRGSAETTGPRIRTSRHDGGSGRCSDSSRPAPLNAFCQPMPRSTTPSTPSAISFPAAPSASSGPRRPVLGRWPRLREGRAGKRRSPLGFSSRDRALLGCLSDCCHNVGMTDQGCLILDHRDLHVHSAAIRNFADQILMQCVEPLTQLLVRMADTGGERDARGRTTLSWQPAISRRSTGSNEAGLRFSATLGLSFLICTAALSRSSAAASSSPARECCAMAAILQQAPMGTDP